MSLSRIWGDSREARTPHYLAPLILGKQHSWANTPRLIWLGTKILNNWDDFLNGPVCHPRFPFGKQYMGKSMRLKLKARQI